MDNLQGVIDFLQEMKQEKEKKDNRRQLVNEIAWEVIDEVRNERVRTIGDALTADIVGALRDKGLLVDDVDWNIG